MHQETKIMFLHNYISNELCCLTQNLYNYFFSALKNKPTLYVTAFMLEYYILLH